MEVGRKPVTLFWCLLAVFVGLLALWQTKVLLADGGNGARGQAPLPPPEKTKHASRSPDAGFQGSPVASYIAKCREGVTDQEIRWALEDFHNAGLDQVPAEKAPLEDLIKFGQIRNRWYLESLVQGLHLSPEQEAQARKNLATVLEPHIGESHSATYLFFLVTSAASWKICELTPEQSLIGWQRIQNADGSISVRQKKLAHSFQSRFGIRNGNPVHEVRGTLYPQSFCPFRIPIPRFPETSS